MRVSAQGNGIESTSAGYLLCPPDKMVPGANLSLDKMMPGTNLAGRDVGAAHAAGGLASGAPAAGLHGALLPTAGQHRTPLPTVLGKSVLKVVFAW